VPGSVLPTVDAACNAASCAFLVAGLVAIKSGRRALHARLMLSAVAASAVFLVCYLYYHFVVVPEIGHVPFRRTGWVRTAYFVMLASHVALAIVMLPLILRTLWLAHRERWPAHRRWARWTFPIWLYVSVTGVLVYLALYRWNPPPE
jgi:uncharacterized membrane protein YozB (DUF420 family)